MKNNFKFDYNEDFMYIFSERLPWCYPYEKYQAVNYKYLKELFNTEPFRFHPKPIDEPIRYLTDLKVAIQSGELRKVEKRLISYWNITRFTRVKYPAAGILS